MVIEEAMKRINFGLNLIESKLGLGSDYKLDEDNEEIATIVGGISGHFKSL